MSIIFFDMYISLNTHQSTIFSFNSNPRGEANQNELYEDVFPLVRKEKNVFLKLSCEWLPGVISCFLLMCAVPLFACRALFWKNIEINTCFKSLLIVIGCQVLYSSLAEYSIDIKCTCCVCVCIFKQDLTYKELLYP